MLFCAPYTFIVLIQPLFVERLLKYIQTGSVNLVGLESGTGIAILLGIISILASLSLNYGFYHITIFAVYCRSSAIAMIFQKALRLSSSAHAKRTTGEIVTLMSSDAEKLWYCMIFVNWLWMGPLQIAGAITLLYLRVGPAALVAGSAIVFLQVFQGKLGGRDDMLTEPL